MEPRYTILVPLDFSENSLKALNIARSAAEKRKGKIILVHVVNVAYDFATESTAALDAHFKEAESQLKTLAARHRTDAVDIEPRVLTGNASIQITTLAADEEANLIVMGTQGASGIEKALIGSMTVSVVREAKCPVLIVPAQADIARVKKVTLALEFADHEEKFIDWIVDMSRRWEFALEVLHVQTSSGFKEELTVLGMEKYLHRKYPDLEVRIHTFYSPTASEGLELYLQEHDNMILVMCHQHQNLWEQIFQKSQSIEMAYHTRVPLLIMN